LFSNSIKYSPPGTTVRVDASRTDAGVLVRVINQGPPVVEENLDRIFDKFHRVTAADKITGTGLGLSICKGIIEAHKGHIWAENLPEGFSIQFTLPIPTGDTPVIQTDL
jgi:two-component system sensor histidine kinase KdpD